jgi:hypothetical protein
MCKHYTGSAKREVAHKRNVVSPEYTHRQTMSKRWDSIAGIQQGSDSTDTAWAAKEQWWKQTNKKKALTASAAAGMLRQKQATLYKKGAINGSTTSSNHSRWWEA